MLAAVRDGESVFFTGAAGTGKSYASRRNPPPGGMLAPAHASVDAQSPRARRWLRRARWANNARQVCTGRAHTHAATHDDVRDGHDGAGGVPRGRHHAQRVRRCGHRQRSCRPAGTSGENPRQPSQLHAPTPETTWYGHVYGAQQAIRGPRCPLHPRFSIQLYWTSRSCDVRHYAAAAPHMQLRARS